MKYRIQQYLMTNLPASVTELARHFRIERSVSSRIIKELYSDNLIERATCRGGVHRYRLTKLHDWRKEKIIEYFETYSCKSVSDVSEDLGMDKNDVVSILETLHKDKLLSREKCSVTKAYRYSPYVEKQFGMYNTWTKFINEQLSQVRANYI